MDDLVSNYGQQFVFQMDDNLFSSCHSGVPAGKVQGSELSLDMLLLSAAATRQVIMGYKCEHEGCQKSFESRKRHNVHRQRNCGKSYETSSSGANSFRAARRMLSAQSFISSPMSSRHIKVRKPPPCATERLPRGAPPPSRRPVNVGSVRHLQKGTTPVLSVIRRRALATVADCGISMWLP